MKVLAPAIFKDKKPHGRRPKYSMEYCQNMAKRVDEDGLTLREAAKIYKMSHGSVCYWTKIYREGKMPIKAKRDKKFEESRDAAIIRLEAFITSLKSEIGELYLENQILKKAQVFLRQQKKLSSSAITSANLDQWNKDAK